LTERLETLYVGVFPYAEQISLKDSGGKSTPFSYLRKSKVTLIEKDSRKSESIPGKYYLNIWF
jgi:hypothetical protein